MSLTSNWMSPATRARIALALLAVFGLAALGNAASALVRRQARLRTVAHPSDGRAPVRAVVYEERFAAIAEIGSPGLVAGYITDKLERGVFTDPVGLQEFFLTQYAVAPIVLARGTGPPLVIANFPDLDDPESIRRAAALAERLGLLRDYGDGVLLLGSLER